MIKDTQPFERKGAKKNLFLLLKKYTEDFNKLLSFVLRIQTKDNEIIQKKGESLYPLLSPFFPC